MKFGGKRGEAGLSQASQVTAAAVSVCWFTVPLAAPKGAASRYERDRDLWRFATWV
jgi:hypothetical protein